MQPQYLNRHIKMDHPIAHPCDECEEAFSTTQLLSDHFHEMHLSQDKTCPVCDKIFENETQVKQHLIDAHPMGVKSTCVCDSRPSSTN